MGEQGPVAQAPPGVDMECLRARVEEQFADTGANRRGITVVKDEQLILERCAAHLENILFPEKLAALREGEGSGRDGERVGIGWSKE